MCELFETVGPDAPTLCAGWTARDLAAHLVLRERRPDAAPGILFGPLAGHTRRVQDGYAARPWAALIGLLRDGPPRLSPTSVGAVDDVVNGGEFLVHHEDVRRARPGWEPRPEDTERDAAAWSALRWIARLSFRRSPVGVVLGVPGGAELTAKRAAGRVIVRGAPVDLLLYAFGRDEVELAFEGEKAALDGVSRGL